VDLLLLVVVVMNQCRGHNRQTNFCLKTAWHFGERGNLIDNRGKEKKDQSGRAGLAIVGVAADAAVEYGIANRKNLLSTDACIFAKKDKNEHKLWVS
jgi:hypothetical protein